MRHMSRVLAAIAAMGFSAAAWAAPAVTISPTVGPPTTKVKVNVSGFPAATAIDFYFDFTNTCLVITDAAGAATCTIAAPKDAQPQQHWVTALVHNGATGAQKPFVVRTDMAQFNGRNALHNGLNPFENTITPENVGNLDLLWRAPIGNGNYRSGSDSAPVVAGGIVYVASHDAQKLFAFNAVSGAPIAGFPVSLGAKTASGPVVGGGRVYVGADDGKLYAFNAANGAPVGGFPALATSAIQEAPTLALGNLYFVAADWLYAVNTTTGLSVSGFPVALGAYGEFHGSPTIVNGTIYVGASTGKVYAFDALTGAPVAGVGFPLNTGQPIYGTIAANGTSGYVGNFGYTQLGQIWTFRLADGVAVGLASPGNIVGAPALAGGKLVVATVASMVAMYPRGGTFWTQVLSGTIYGSPIVANNVVYLQNTGNIYAFHLLTGAALWGTALYEGTHGSPVVANGILYAADEGGYLYAFSVNGVAPSARLPGGALGVKPALSALKPNPAMKVGQPALPPSPEE